MPADETRLAERDRPPEPDLVGCRGTVGVVPHDHVAFLQAQQTLRLDAEGRDAVSGAGREEPLPDRGQRVCRHMNLVAEFADEAHPEYARGTVGDPSCTAGEIGKGLVREVEIADRGENVACRGAGEIECTVAERALDQRDLEPELRRIQVELAQHDGPANWSC